MGKKYDVQELIGQAKADDAYWTELALLEFSEDVIARMEHLGMSRSELAQRIDSPVAIFRNDIRQVVLDAVHPFPVSRHGAAVDSRATLAEIDVAFVLLVVNKMTDIGNGLGLTCEFIAVLQVTIVLHLFGNIL